MWRNAPFFDLQVRIINEYLQERNDIWHDKHSLADHKEQWPQGIQSILHKVPWNVNKKESLHQ
jgi:hypothetical protein